MTGDEQFQQLEEMNRTLACDDKQINRLEMEIRELEAEEKVMYQKLVQNYELFGTWLKRNGDVGKRYLKSVDEQAYKSILRRCESEEN